VWFTSAGVIVAMVLIVALWAALGEGSVWLRAGMLVVIVCLASAALALTAQLFGNQWLFQGSWYSWSYWHEVWDRERWIFAWIGLAGGILFAALLFYRALGYRLSREVRPS
jgi:hypothetical protein